MKRTIAFAKIILVIALIVGYFYLVQYEEFHRGKRKAPLQKDLLTTFGCLATGVNTDRKSCAVNSSTPFGNPHFW